MEFIEAVKKADANKHLVGKIYKGAVIDEIIIAPNNEKEFDLFLKSYLHTLDAQASIVPFMSSDVGVYIIFDKNKIRQENLFPFMTIDKLPQEYNVV